MIHYLNYFDNRFEKLEIPVRSYYSRFKRNQRKPEDWSGAEPYGLRFLGLSLKGHSGQLLRKREGRVRKRIFSHNDKSPK